MGQNYSLQSFGTISGPKPRGTRPMSQPVTMFTTVWCGYCRRLKRGLEEAGIAYREVDVDDEPRYNERIVKASGGYRTVPTVQVGDELLVNPSAREVAAAVAGVPAGE